MIDEFDMLYNHPTIKLSLCESILLKRLILIGKKVEMKIARKDPANYIRAY